MFVVQYNGEDAHVTSPDGEHKRIPQFVFNLADSDEERDECARGYVRQVFQHTGDIAVLH